MKAGKKDVIQDFLNLTDTLTQFPGIEEQFNRISDWLASLPRIKVAKIIDLLYRSDAPALPERAIYTENPRQFLGSLLPEDWQNGTLIYPLFGQNGESLGTLLLGTESGMMSELEPELSLVTRQIKEMLEKERLREELGRLRSISGPAPGKEGKGIDRSALDKMLPMGSFNLPFYTADMDGRFLHTNQLFLELVKHSNIEELNRAQGFFVEPEKREQELLRLRREGRASDVRLTLLLGDGRKLTVQESAFVLGSRIYGMLFDITDLIELNQEAQEALEMQEFLNDRIFESALILNKTQTAAIQALARLAEYRDAETGDHLHRIGEYSRLLAGRVYEKNPYGYKLGSEYVNDIAISSMLHDIGKVGVPDSILLKPGRLTPKEWEIMKTHTTLGWAILDKADRELGEQSFLTLASNIALHHHERHDGQGYPHGLAGEEIPLSARIVSVVDVYDALTTKRPYKDPWPHAKAVREICNQEGRQFCPKLVDLFRDIHEGFQEIRQEFPR